MEQLSPQQLAALAADDLGPLNKKIGMTFAVTAFLIVLLRIFVRVRNKSWGWEDHVMVVAEALTMATAILNVKQANDGGGKHIAVLTSMEQVELILKELLLCVLLYYVSLTLVKVSILLQYRRIFPIAQMRLPINLSLAFVIIWGICTFFTGLFVCVPVDAFWRLEKRPTAKCMTDTTLYFVNASVNIVSDLLVALLPVRSIWNLQIPKRQKIVLLLILTIGGFVCVVSVLRLHSLVRLAQNPNDRIYYSAAPAYWSMVEVNLSIICASIPTLKPLLVKIVPGFSSQRSRGYQQPSIEFVNKSSGTTSTATKGGDVELTATSVSSNKHSSKTSQSDQGNQWRNIYVSRQFEQHVEENWQASDAESQKNLVTGPVSSPTHKNFETDSLRTKSNNF